MPTLMMPCKKSPVEIYLGDILKYVSVLLFKQKKGMVNDLSGCNIWSQLINHGYEITWFWISKYIEFNIYFKSGC